MYKSSMPTKALICYCPVQPNQPIPNVDLVVEKGCSGQMVLEGQKDDTTVLQLLGLYEEKNFHMKSKFKERFNDLSLAIISNCNSTKELALTLDTNFSNINTILEIQQILQSKDIDIVFIDFTDYANAWSFINDLITVESVNYIQCIVSPTAKKDELNNVSSIIPRQSFSMKDGFKVTDINNKTELIYGYYHAGSGRKDNSSKYNVKNITENGGNCKILVWHFLAEIGHKLGFVPKYGA